MKNDIIAIDVSEDYIHHVDRLLERSKLEIFEWFEKPVDNTRIKTYIYKDVPSLREGLIRRLNREYPWYLQGCQVDEDKENGISRSINIYETPVKNENGYNRREYNSVIYHELVHYITDILFGKVPEWICEGIALNLDGSYKQDLTNLMKIVNTYQIPEVSKLIGDTFVVKEGKKTIYNGYDYSYLMVRYIIETLGKDYLFTLMKNQDQIPLVEQTTLIEAIEYFNCQYLEEKTIKTPNL